MIKLKTKLKNFDIPTSYSDLKVADYEFIRENDSDQVKIAQRLTGLSVSQIALIDWAGIRPHLDFLQVSPLEAVEAENFIKLNDTIYTLPENVGACWFAQKLAAFSALQKNDLLSVLCIYLQPVISGPDFDPKNLPDIRKLILDSDMDSVYSCVSFIIEQLKKISEDEKMLDLKPTPEQIEAGIKMFNVLGDFNVIDQLATQLFITYEQVLKMDYNTIFNKLLKNNITAKYDRAYSKIINKPKPGS